MYEEVPWNDHNVAVYQPVDIQWSSQQLLSGGNVPIEFNKLKHNFDGTGFFNSPNPA